jgi:hypothetical protein
MATKLCSLLCLLLLLINLWLKFWFDFAFCTSGAAGHLCGKPPPMLEAMV